MAVYHDIVGVYVTLKAATEDDAEFTLRIRQEPQFVRFLPRVNNTLEQQKAWIRNQREKDGDFFFVVYNKANERIGTIGAYGIGSDHPETGRLAIKGDAFENSEAMYLLQDFVFNTLDIKQTFGFMYADNKRVINFNKKFGALVGEPVLDEQQRLIRPSTNNKKRFNDHVPMIKRMLYNEK